MSDPWALAPTIVRVITLIPGDTRCLMRSMTLLTVLARRGVATTLVIGASDRPDAPFEGHAWVELDGKPLLPPLAQDRRMVEL